MITEIANWILEKLCFIVHPADSSFTCSMIDSLQYD